MKKIALVLATALTFAACGGGNSAGPGSPELFSSGPGENTAGAGGSPSTPAEDGESESGTQGGDLPSVEVIDVASGETFDFSSLAPADEPLLVWFWAPH